MKQKIRIGSGAGFSGDRIEPALILAEKGELDYLVLECLAERTIALAQKEKLANPELGYDPLLEKRLIGLLPLLARKKIRLITNMGAANPIAAAKKVREMLVKAGLNLKIATVTGDDVLEKLDLNELSLEGNKAIKNYPEIISANAYLGHEGILEALQNEAQIIITGRVADPSLFLAPMIHEFGWDTQNFDLLGKGTVIGHLMECAGQITGGYFADPLKKPVPGMETLGHPFADIFPDGKAIISKVNGTGGVVNLQTVKEQLLYEVINPFQYLTPDVAADFTTVKLHDLQNDRVEIRDGTGNKRPETLKVSIGYLAYFKGEGEISYAGTGAFERAKLAEEIIVKRIGNQFSEFRTDLLGINSLHKSTFGQDTIPYEIRLRVAGKARSIEDAKLIGEEVEALYTNGPAAGGGVIKRASEIIGIVSVLMNRKKINTQVTYL